MKKKKERKKEKTILKKKGRFKVGLHPIEIKKVAFLRRRNTQLKRS